MLVQLKSKMNTPVNLIELSAAATSINQILQHNTNDPLKTACQQLTGKSYLFNQRKGDEYVSINVSKIRAYSIKCAFTAQNQYGILNGMKAIHDRDTQFVVEIVLHTYAVEGYEMTPSVIKHLNHGDAIHATNIVRPLAFIPGVNASSQIWNKKKLPLVIRKLKGLKTNGMPKKEDDQRKSSDATSRMKNLRESNDNKNQDDSSMITEMVDNVISNNSMNENNTSIDSISRNMATGSISTASSEPQKEHIF
jgi:hypothetical protein